MTYRIHPRPCQYCGKIGVYCKELCKGCYTYRERHGSPERKITTVEQRFWAKVDKTGEAGCWVWTASRSKKGYGLFTQYAEYSPSAHRTAWMLMRGHIPQGLQLDHLCRNTACVNPEHLEPVTGRENMRRAVEARTSCRNNHALSGDNLRIDKNNKRWCRACLTNNRIAFHARNPEYMKTGKRSIILRGDARNG